MPEISIILPVYNPGKVLIQTFNSIRLQTYEDWELIVVDDGSTDESVQICDDFAAIDKRIRVFHKENGGICNARNYALSKCLGRYIAFCDHDDEYSINQLSLLYDAITSTDSDFSSCSARYVFDNGTSKICFKLNDEILFVDNVKNYYIELYKNGLLETVWNKLYRKEFLINNCVHFQESLKHGGEDIEFNNAIIRLSPRCIFIPDTLYIHYLRKSLSTSAKFWPDNADMIYKQFLSFNETVDKINALNMRDLNLYDDVYYFYFHLYSSYLAHLKIGISGFCKKCNDFKKNKKTIDNHNKIVREKGFANSIVIFLLNIGCYSILYWLFQIDFLWKKIVK